MPAPAPAPRRKSGALKWVLIALAAVVLLAGAGIGVFYAATHGTTNDGYVYRLSIGSHAVITDYEGSGGEITIPDQIRGLPVTVIEARAFINRDDITGVTVDSSVQPQNKAFSGCDGISRVSFEGDALITSLWAEALRDCKNLKCIFFLEEDVYDRCVRKDTLEKLSGVVLCCKGQDTGWGLIKSVESSNGIVYAFTDEKNAVVLSLPDGVDGDMLSPTLSGYQVILPDGRIPGQKDPVYGQTADGYAYEITADRTLCIITGYHGDKSILVMPDEIEGYTITTIGEGAFSGNTAIESVFLPIGLKEIRSKAFSGCSNLRDIYVFSNCTASSDAFASCPRLRCAVLESGVSLAGWTLPSDLRTYYYGEETGIGKLDYVVISNNGTIYGVTQDDRALVMDLADSVTELELSDTVDGYPVEWIHEDALDGVAYTAVIHLPANALFPYELWNAVDWEFLDSESQFTLAECWWYSCYVCSQIRQERSTPVIEVDSALLRAVMLRAQELSQYNDHARPDGSDWGTVLNDFGVDWDYASAWRSSYANGSSGLAEKLDWIIEAYAVPEEERNYDYYDRIAVGLYYDSESDTVYLMCIATMID